MRGRVIRRQRAEESMRRAGLDVDPDAPITRRLHAKWFGARAFDWGDGTLDFQIPHGEWVRLFRRNGFEIEDLIELRDAGGGIAHRPSAREQ